MNDDPVPRGFRVHLTPLNSDTYFDADLCVHLTPLNSDTESGARDVDGESAAQRAELRRRALELEHRPTSAIDHFGAQEGRG